MAFLLFNVWSQNWHLKLSGRECMFLACFIIFSWHENVLSHKRQGTRNSAWVSMCRWREFLAVYDLGHSGQWNCHKIKVLLSHATYQNWYISFHKKLYLRCKRVVLYFWIWMATLHLSGVFLVYHNYASEKYRYHSLNEKGQKQIYKLKRRT